MTLATYSLTLSNISRTPSSAFSSAWMNTERGRYISPNSDVLTGDSRHGEMDGGRVGEGAITIRGIKILDQFFKAKQIH